MSVQIPAGPSSSPVTVLEGSAKSITAETSWRNSGIVASSCLKGYLVSRTGRFVRPRVPSSEHLQHNVQSVIARTFKLSLCQALRLGTLGVAIHEETQTSKQL